MDADSYRAHIDRLILQQSGEIVLNGSHSHATIIIERMFANANHSIDILCRRFDPRIFGTPELVEQAYLFLGGFECRARIIIEDISAERLEHHPFIERCKSFVEGSVLVVKQLPEAISQTSNINFAVMDRVGIRFESDKTAAAAVASFGNSELVDKASALFDNLWQRSKEISLPLSQVG
jgi:hypothetical protein